MMMLSQVTRLRICTSYRWKWIGCVSTPLCVIFQICVPSSRRMVAIWTSPSGRRWRRPSPRFGRLVASMSSVAGLTNGYSDDVLRRRGRRLGLDAEVGLSSGRTRRRSVEFISSWRAFGCSGIDRLGARCLQRVEAERSAVSLTRDEAVTALQAGFGWPAERCSCCSPRSWCRRPSCRRPARR